MLRQETGRLSGGHVRRWVDMIAAITIARHLNDDNMIIFITLHSRIIISEWISADFIYVKILFYYYFQQTLCQH